MNQKLQLSRSALKREKSTTSLLKKFVKNNVMHKHFATRIVNNEVNKVKELVMLDVRDHAITKVLRIPSDVRLLRRCLQLSQRDLTKYR
jgi:hypothetical protein